MAYKKSYIESVEQSILDSCKKDKILEEEEIDDSHLQNKKRDKLSVHVSNKQKKVKCDEAMELQEQMKYEEDPDNYEGDFEIIEGEGSAIQKEIIEARAFKKKKSEELTKKMEKYKTGKASLQHPAFNGLHMNEMQKKFVINYCDPESPYYNDKHLAYTASGYTAKNKNSLMANISMNLKKEKIKTAIDRYRKSVINSKKLEISTEMVDILRRRATYKLSTFYDEKGEMIPFKDIPEEWQCCVDDRSLSYQTQKGIKVERYQLCDRHKSMQELMKLMEIQQSISNTPKNVGGRPPSSVTAAIDMGKDKDGNQGPRVVFNITPYQKSEEED